MLDLYLAEGVTPIEGERPAADWEEQGIEVVRLPFEEALAAGRRPARGRQDPGRLGLYGLRRPGCGNPTRRTGPRRTPRPAGPPHRPLTRRFPSVDTRRALARRWAWDAGPGRAKGGDHGRWHPAELKDHEYRVAITPVGVRELTDAGHRVLVEQGAGWAAPSPTSSSEKSGATVLETADEVWGEADLVLKVKEPVPEEFHRLRKDQVLFTYLHLAASREVTEALLKSGTTAVAYETVELADGRLPLLAPMSEVAGRMAPRSALTCWSASPAGAGC